MSNIIILLLLLTTWQAMLHIDAFQIIQYRPLPVGGLPTGFHPSSSITCNISTTRCIRTSGVIFSSASADNNNKEEEVELHGSAFLIPNDEADGLDKQEAGYNIQSVQFTSYGGEVVNVGLYVPKETIHTRNK